MGYNGSNRRLKRSVIKKSSLNFGTNLVSSLIAMPIAAVLAAPNIERSNRVGNNRKVISNPSMICSENIIKIPVEVITLITTNKYRHIITDLDDLIQENKLIERTMFLKEKELSQLKVRKAFFIFCPIKKTEVKAKLFNLRNEIEELNKKKRKEILDIKELRDVKREEKLLSLREWVSTSKLSISNESSSFFDSPIVYNYFILNRVKAEISFNSNTLINEFPVLTISALHIDIFFLGVGVIVKSEGNLAIISYENLNLSYQEVRIKEDEYFDINGYVLDSYTFLHTKLDGNADLRYSYNPKNPIIKYGKLSLEMSDNLTLNIFFDNYAVGHRLYEVINTDSTNQGGGKINSTDKVNQCVTNIDTRDIFGQGIGKKQVYPNDLSKIDTIVDASNSWDEDMHNLLASADRLMENKKYEKAKIEYTRLLDVATLRNSYQLYGYIATGRLKDLKEKLDLLESCNPDYLFNIERINRIIEEARFYEAEKDYKKALSKYMEVRMYGIMYSSAPYVDLAKSEIERLKKLKA